MLCLRRFCRFCRFRSPVVTKCFRRETFLRPLFTESLHRNMILVLFENILRQFSGNKNVGSSCFSWACHSFDQNRGLTNKTSEPKILPGYINPKFCWQPRVCCVPPLLHIAKQNTLLKHGCLLATSTESPAGVCPRGAHFLVVGVDQRWFELLSIVL